MPDLPGVGSSHSKEWGHLGLHSLSLPIDVITPTMAQPACHMQSDPSLGRGSPLHERSIGSSAT